MEIKIQCDCGQRYKLDVEPANGVMPFAVNCPICGVDGTQKGTELIQQALAPSAATEVTPTAAVPGRLRINLERPAPAPVAQAAVESEATPMAPSKLGRMGALAKAEAASATGRKPNFGLGLLGGFAGALVGAVIYYLIVKTTGLRISYFAIGVGGLAGWLAELCGKGEGSKELAAITAILTVAFIIGAQYFITREVWNEMLGPDFNQPAYDRAVNEARSVVKKVPTGSDAEIRGYLAAEQADDGAKPDPTAVAADDIKQFHDVQLPQYQDLASGKISRDQYNSQNTIDPAKDQKKAATADGTFKAFFVLQLIRWRNLVSLAAAAGIAFRLCANA